MEPARCSPSRTEVTMEIPASTPSPKSLGFRRRSVGCFSRPERSAAERGAGAHRDDPFRFGHLVVDSLYGKSHLVGDGTGHDHYVRLPRGESHYFCAKPRDVVTGTRGSHHLDCATGKTHRHWPQGIFSHPIDTGVEPGENNVSLNL